MMVVAHPKVANCDATRLALVALPPVVGVFLGITLIMVPVMKTPSYLHSQSFLGLCWLLKATSNEASCDIHEAMLA
jgi:hypothetical protein